jgi:PhnB protein
MQVNPYLSFDGQCEAAFTFYAQVLGGQVGAAGW